MTDIVPIEPRLSADLAELRAALRELRVPTATEDSLREAFRRHRVRSGPPSVGARPQRSRVWQGISLSMAAALCAVAFSGFWDSAPSGPRSSSAPLATAPSAAEALPAFQPLEAFAAAPSSSLAVVRVRIPLSSLAIVPGTEAQGSIEAELLIGEDGIARAIRFPAADVERRSAAAN